MEIHQIHGDSVIGFVRMFGLMETGLADFCVAVAVFLLNFQCIDFVVAVAVFQILIGLPQFTHVTSSNSKVQLKLLCRITYLELLEPKTCETCSALQEDKPPDQTMITA